LAIVVYLDLERAAHSLDGIGPADWIKFGSIEFDSVKLLLDFTPRERSEPRITAESGACSKRNLRFR
jgi:hypothetical protein